MPSDVTKLLRIGELATLTDKTKRALHLYEQMELLCPADRSQGGFRLYDAENVSRIGYIDRLQKLGYSLSQIRDLVKEWRAQTSPAQAMAGVETVYRSRLEEVRRTIADLRALETELEQSLEFLGGCHGCGHDHSPKEACGHCDRPDDVDLHLIRGLKAH